MRVTRESLIRIAKDAAQERAYNDRSIVAAYLTGSLVSNPQPMLGGTTDIDLVLVHDAEGAAARQIVKLTPDFHLDIRHRARSDFKSPRELRTDPQLGWELYDPMLLYQREKFFEFVQAGLRAGFEFNAPSLVMGRCRKLLVAARNAWRDLTDMEAKQSGARQVMQFLSALRDAANTVAETSGPPLAERRLLLDFVARAQAAERPEFTATVFNLLGASQTDAAIVAAWIPQWKADFLAAAAMSTADPGVHAARLNYYEKAIQALLAGETPLTSLWPLLFTWTLAAGVLIDPPSQAWSDACNRLGLLGPSLIERASSLDGFLDEIEVLLDEISSANGLDTSSSL